MISIDKKLIIEELSKIYTALSIDKPYLTSLIRALKILITEKPDAPAIFTTDKELVINAHFWKNLKLNIKKFIIEHECFHLILRHAVRVKELYDKRGIPINISGIAADVIVNSLVKIPEEFKDKVITPELIANLLKINIDEIRKMSMEEIALLLYKHEDEVLSKVSPPSDIEYSISILTGSSTFNYEVLQEGDYELYGKKGQDFEEELKRRLLNALIYAKLIGKVPEGFNREVNWILKSKIDWKGILREALREGFIGSFWRTWLKINRKMPDELPGHKVYTTPKILVLLDTSGSITERELEQFACEVLNIARNFNTEVYVVFWDAEAYEVLRIRRPSELLEKWKKYCKGGGGTVIKPALEMALKIHKSSDEVIILSDGLISDIHNIEVQEVLSRLAMKSSKAIFVTTLEIPKLPSKFKVIKIEI